MKHEMRNKEFPHSSRKDYEYGYDTVFSQINCAIVLSADFDAQWSSNPMPKERTLCV